MKANRDFKIYTNKEGTLVSYYSGDSKENIVEIKVKKGEEIPKHILEDIKENIPDYVDFKSKSEKKLKEEAKKYTKEELELFPFSKLKEIAEKLGQTGRSSTGLIKDILANQ